MEVKNQSRSTTNALWSGRIVKSVAVLLSLIAILSLGSVALAQTNVLENTNAVANAAGVNPNQDIFQIIGRIINIALGTVGVLFLGIMLYAGFLYMTAGGDPEKTKKAILWIRNAVIGIIIIGLSFAIVNYILGLFASSGMFGGGFGGGGGAGGGGGFGQAGNSGCLGSGNIEVHYPTRDQKGVARNSAIVITFKTPVDPASFVKGWDANNQNITQINSDLVKVHPQKNTSQDLLPDQAKVKVSDDKRTVIIKPTDLLGNAKDPTWYEVALDGGIKNASGTQLLNCDLKAGYSWSFEVSTVVDNTPPRVISVIPSTAGPHARNIITQINFSEPMLPPSVSGFYNHQSQTGNFINITLTNKDVSQIIDGQYKISNGYRTTEFIPTEACGTNSCLQTVYCLPKSAPIESLIKAANINAPGQSEMIFDGAADMAGNSLDGNNNGVSDGQPTDNYSFSFGTGDNIDLRPPMVTGFTPGVLESQVAFDKPITISWNSPLLSSSVNSDNVTLGAAGPKETSPIWFAPTLVYLNDKNEEATLQDGPTKSKITISHRAFLPSDPNKKGQDPWKALNLYAPSTNQYVMNLYQNCFNPASWDQKGDGSIIIKGSNNLCNGKDVGDVECSKTKVWYPQP